MDKKTFADMNEFSSFCDQWRPRLYTHGDRSLAGLSMAGTPEDNGRTLVLHFSSSQTETTFRQAFKRLPEDDEFGRALNEVAVYTLVIDPQTAERTSKPQPLTL